MATGSTTAHGSLRMQVVRAPKPALTLAVAREHGLPRPGQPREVRAWKQANEEHLYRGIRDLEDIERGRGPAFMGALWAVVHRRGQAPLDLGLVSGRVVTTAGVNFIRDAFLNTTELELMKFHGMGTGSTAEASSDTALVTEMTTAYTTDNTRPTGTLVSGGTGIFQTVATVTVDASVAATEHGIFSQAATGGGTLLDRSVFAVVNLASTEAIQFSYNLTLPAGG
jgi:hypothetical protein